MSIWELCRFWHGLSRSEFNDTFSDIPLNVKTRTKLLSIYLLIEIVIVIHSRTYLFKFLLDH